MALPVVPVLKLIALGSIKIVLLGIGALVVPVFTIKMVLGGTGESIRIATQWMIDHDQLNAQEAEIFLESLTKVQQANFTRSQARGLLFIKIRKSALGTLTGFKKLWQWMLSPFKK